MSEPEKPTDDNTPLLHSGMNAVPLPFSAPVGDFSDGKLYRLVWATLKMDGSQAAEPEALQGIWRKVSSTAMQDGDRKALGPDGTREGEPVVRMQAYRRWEEGEKAIAGLVPANEVELPW